MNSEAVKSAFNRVSKAFFDALSTLDTTDEKLAFTSVVSSTVDGMESMLKKLRKMLDSDAIPTPVVAPDAPPPGHDL